MKNLWWMPLLVSCGALDRAAPSAEREQKTASKDEEGWGGGLGGAPAMEAAPAPSSAPMAPGRRGEADDLAQKEAEKPSDGVATVAGSESSAAPTRAWFPESFLWAPMVETDATGVATLPVTVPDTLTTWRVLALAQSTRGGQGGAVTTFDSTLPAYVDVVTPRFLYAGDELALPVQVVNQEGTPLRAALDVRVDGGSGAAAGMVDVGAYGSFERVVSVAAGAPGTLTVRATLGEVDAIERSFGVRPVGREVALRFGGTLGGPREIAIDGVPGGQFGGMEVVVFPGALSVVDRELGLAAGRGDSVFSAAYAWALVDAGRPLAGEGTHTDDSLRALRLTAWQRLARLTRAPDARTAAAALVGLQAADADALEGRLRERLRAQVAEAQQPDGLWTVEPGAPLDVAILDTARAAWALGEGTGATRGARVRAAGAVERYRDRLDDPAVAAWVLAAGIADPGEEEALRALVTNALVTAPDGSAFLPGGARVSTGEATAIAILAITDEARRADLASGLLARWSAGAGFGPGWSNLVALRALALAMKGEIPREVALRVELDGVEVARGSLDPAQPHAPVVLRGPALPGAGSHTVRLVAEPAVPGLAFALTTRTYLPWTQSAPAGLDLVVTPPSRPRVGEPAVVDVAASGPVGARVRLEIALPAGVEVDRAGLAGAVAGGMVEGWRAEDGAVYLDGVRLEGGTFRVAVPVTPTLAGQLSTGASRVVLEAGEGELVRVPQRWRVVGG